MGKIKTLSDSQRVVCSKHILKILVNLSLNVLIKMVLKKSVNENYGFIKGVKIGISWRKITDVPFACLYSLYRLGIPNSSVHALFL